MTKHESFIGDLGRDQALEVIENLLPVAQRAATHQAKTDEERMAIAAEVHALVRLGYTTASIAEKMGFSEMTAYNYRSLAYSTITLPSYDDAIKEQVMIIDTMIEALQGKIKVGRDKQAMALMTKVLERKSKLLGLDKPERVDVQTTEVSAQEREMQDLIAQAERDQLMREAEMRDSASTNQD